MADVQSNIKVSIDTTEALASIKNLQRQISAFHTSMAKGGAAANAVTAQMQQTLINSVNATGKFSAQMRTIKTTTESFTDSLEKNKFSMGEYFRYAGGASKSFGRLFKTEFETINKVARENVKDLQTQYIKMGRDANGAMKAIAVRPLTLDMDNLATKTMVAAQKQAILNQLLKQGSTNLLNFGKNTQWAGRQLMVGFTIPLMALGAAASKTFMDMETQAIRFKKVYGDLFTSTTESTAALDAIKNLGKEFTKYGIAVSDTVGLAAEAAAAGFKGVDLQRQTTAATRLSILGQVESQKALETTIALQNAFSMSSEDLAKNIDFLNAVENQTVLSLDDMSTAIPKAAPVIQQLGGDVKDLAFFMAAMKEGGINASEGANALKSGLASMINPTGKAAAMLEGLGINIKKIVVDNKGDLKKTVTDFATALNQLDPLNRAQAIEQMFGKFQFARLSTLFANVTKEGTQAARVLDLAGASIQDLAALSEKELGQTSESAMNKFKSSVEQLKLALVPVGEQFLKVITPIAEFITKILDKFNNLGDGTKKVIVVLTAVIAGLGPVLLMTFGLLMNGLANIIKGFTFLKSIFNKAGRATGTLGDEVKYMTTEQRNAAAVASSLDQVHRNLAQTFSSEAAAVDALTRAYYRAVAAQSQFMPVRVPLQRGSVTKRAKGKPARVGGTGNQDSELALLMPGETVIPTKMSKKYGAIINGMIADKIPGYSTGKGRPGGHGTNVKIPGGFAAAHFGGSSYMSGDDLLAMLDGRTDNMAESLRTMVAAMGDSSKELTVFTNEVIATSMELNEAFGKTGSKKEVSTEFAQAEMLDPKYAQVRDIELQRRLEAAGMPIEKIREVNEKITTEIGNGFNALRDEFDALPKAITAEHVDKIVSDAYDNVAKAEKGVVEVARREMKDVTALTDPSNLSRRPVTDQSYKEFRANDAKTGTSPYYDGMERIAGKGNVPYSPEASFRIRNDLGDSLGLSTKDASLVYKQFSDEVKVKLSKLRGDVVKFTAEFEKEAQIAGLKTGNAYKTGVDKSGLQDIYVEARKRNSPHPLASKDGKDDAIAYGKARRKATRAQGPVPISVIPVSTIDPRVIPFSDIDPQIIPQVIPPGYVPPEGPMLGPRKPTKYDKTFGKVAAKFRGTNGKIRGIPGMGMGLSSVAMMGSSMVPGKAGDVVQKVSMVGFALSSLQPAISALVTSFGAAAVAITAAIALAVIGIGVGWLLVNKAANKAADRVTESAKIEAEARVGSARAITQFGKTFNKSLPSEREFSRNNRQGIKGSGKRVDEFAKDYATEGNIDTQIINKAALKGQSSGINAIALSVANRAAMYGLSPDDIAANIKAASDLIGADQIKVKLAVQKLLSPDGKDILKEPLTIQARMEFLKNQSAPAITAVKQQVKALDDIDFGNTGATNTAEFDYARLKKAAGKQISINESYAGNWLGNIAGASKQVYRGIEQFIGINGESPNYGELQTTDVVTKFAEAEAKIKLSTTTVSIAFMQQTEALALLNAQYADGLISKEDYDAQMVVSGQNFESLQKSSISLVKQLKKIDPTGKLAAAAVEDLGNQALATLKKSNPALFDQITASMKGLGAASQIKLFVGYQQGSLTLMDLAILPDLLKSIAGKTYEVAIDLILNSGLSKEGGEPTALLIAEQAELAKTQAYANKQNYLDVPTQQKLARLKANIAKYEAQIAAAKKVNKSGNLDSDLNGYEDLQNGTDKAKTATERYLEVLQKEIDALKAKRDAQKDANDEIQREIDLKNKLEDLQKQSIDAKISGDYIKSAMLTQEANQLQIKYDQETELKKKDAEIARLEARYNAIKDGAKLTKIEIAKTPKLANGGAVKGFNTGGHILGAGTATSDSIPAYLSNGEYVIKADSVSKYGVDTFDALNAGKYAEGGKIGNNPNSNAKSSFGTSSTGVNVSMQGGKLMGPIEAWQDANKQTIKIEVPPITANFATNSYTLNKEQRLELQAIAKDLIKHRLSSIVVQGHTDSVGKSKDNKVLSQNRANAIAEYMSKFVPGTAFTPVGYGEYRPLVPNTTAENKAKNRRAELFLPDKYKTIYPEFVPEKHETFLSKGRIEGTGSIGPSSGSIGTNGTLVSGGSMESVIDWGKLFNKIKKSIGFANGGLIQKFGTGSTGGVKPVPLSKAKLMKINARAGATWQAMEEIEKALSLKWGANQSSSGFSKWSRAIGRVAFNTLQGGVAAGAAAPNPWSVFAGAIAGLGEGVAGISKEGSQYGVRGGKYADPKGSKKIKFNPNKELDNMNVMSSAKNIAMSAGLSSVFGALPFKKIGEQVGKIVPQSVKNFGTNAKQNIMSKLSSANNMKIGNPLKNQKLQNSIASILIGFQKPFLGNSNSSSAAELSLKRTAITSQKSDVEKTVMNQMQQVAFRKEIQTIDDFDYPIYQIGNSKEKISFQGRMEGDTQAARAGVKIVPTTPEGLLAEALSMRPNDTELQQMYANFVGRRFGKKENDFLLRIAAANSFDDDMGNYVYENTDGFAQVLASLTGDRYSKDIIDQKVANLYEQQMQTKENLLNNYYKRSGAHSLLTDRWSVASLVKAGTIKNPNQAPLFHEVPENFTNLIKPRNKDGSIDIYSLGTNSYNYKDPRGVRDIKVGDEAGIGRTTVHYSPEATAFGHTDREGSIYDTIIMSDLGSMMKANPNKLDNANPIDMSFDTNPGEAVKMPNAQFSAAWRDQKKYIKTLTKRGLIKFGDPVPPIIADPKRKEILRLIKESYTDEDRIAMYLARYPEDGLEYAVRRANDNIPEGTEADWIYETAQIMMRRQHGIMAPWSKITGQWSLPGNQQRQYERLADVLGIPMFNHNGSVQGMNETDFFKGSKEGIGSTSEIKSGFQKLSSIRMGVLHGQSKTNIRKTGEELDYRVKAIEEQKAAKAMIQEFKIRHEAWLAALEKNKVKYASGGPVSQKSISAKYNLPSFATGVDYLPNDMIAQLHQGERVLTKEENKTYSTSGPTTNVININGSDLNKKEIAQAVMVELDRAKNKNNKTNLVGG
jgi:TP901 family phage tail tape measure protein